MAALVDSHAGNNAYWDERDDGYEQIKGELDHLASCLGMLLSQLGARLAQDRRWLRDEKNKVLEEQHKLAQNPLSQRPADRGLDLEDPLATIMRSWQMHESNDAEKQKPFVPDYVPFITTAQSESSAHQTLEQPGEKQEEEEEEEEENKNRAQDLAIEATDWLSGPPGIDACNVRGSDVPPPPPPAVASEASKVAPISHRQAGEHRGAQSDPGKSTQGSSSAAAMQPAPASQPEQVARSQASTSEVKKLLDDTWEGSKGETYRLEMPGHSNWRCYRYDRDGENKFKLFLDLERFRVWWSWSFFLDLEEFSSAPNMACWYSANDTSKTRPCFVWRRLRPLST
eukprot:TRINITY_DN10002_c1_g1_i1.p1 TRINITY_DN10002_c1_g1~~TRINITY_DN10002_c1_g1_i1.p1  ORF type:complete len:341 (+),score=74.33 TRINITY_DN10002_c1_g1_i1:68-1090(+)